MDEKKENNNIQAQTNGFPFKWTEKMIDQIEKEQNRTLFGREEKNLLCNYAYHAGNTPEVQAQIREVAASRFEVQNGFVDPVVQRKIQAIIKGIELKWSIAAGQKELHASVRAYLKGNPQGSTRDARKGSDKAKIMAKTIIKEITGGREKNLFLLWGKNIIRFRNIVYWGWFENFFRNVVELYVRLWYNITV